MRHLYNKGFSTTLTAAATPSSSLLAHFITVRVHPFILVGYLSETLQTAQVTGVNV